MKKSALFLMLLMLCALTVKAQEPGEFNKPLNSTYQRIDSDNVSKSLTATPATIFESYSVNDIFFELIGNEDYNKVMLLMMNQTPDSLDLFLPEGITSWRNPCTADTYYSFYTPERINIHLGQEKQFILTNQIGQVLIESGSVLFTDVSCSYNYLTTVYRSYYDPIADTTLQKLLPFNPDTSTLQQFHGESNGYLLIERNYNTTGLASRYIFLDHANEGEIYTALTEDWLDEAFTSLTTHDFIVELENSAKILKSVEIPTIKITNTGVQGATNSVFTIIIDFDMIAPVLTISDEELYQPELIEVTSSEDGIIYLVPKYTDRNLADIRGASLDSIAAVANSAVEMPLSGMENGMYWLYGRDEAGNVSDSRYFSIIGVGIDNILSRQVRIYPNPSFGYINIETREAAPYSIEISTINGQIIHSSNFEGNSEQIDLSSFQRGVYFITVRSKDFVTTGKITKL